jgi:hypothetical protein
MKKAKNAKRKRAVVSASKGKARQEINPSKRRDAFEQLLGDAVLGVPRK